MTQGLLAEPGGAVGNGRNTQHPDTKLPGCQDLRNYRHAHGVRAAGFQSSNFRRRLKAWTQQRDVNPFENPYSLFGCRALSEGAQHGIVSLTHIDESLAPLRLRRAGQRVPALSID